MLAAVTGMQRKRKNVTAGDSLIAQANRIGMVHGELNKLKQANQKAKKAGEEGDPSKPLTNTALWKRTKGREARDLLHLTSVPMPTT